MDGFNLENIIVLLVLLFVLFLIIKFIKGIVKAILAIILIFTLGFSLYNIFVAKKPISYEVNRYKTDFAYLKEINSINKEVSEAVKNIKDNKDIDSNIKQLEALRKRTQSLNHSDEINFIHNRYLGSLDKLILTAKGYNAAEASKEYLDKLSDYTKNLGINLREILFPELEASKQSF